MVEDLDAESSDGLCSLGVALAIRQHYFRVEIKIEGTNFSVYLICWRFSSAFQIKLVFNFWEGMQSLHE